MMQQGELPAMRALVNPLAVVSLYRAGAAKVLVLSEDYAPAQFTSCIIRFNANGLLAPLLMAQDA